MFPKNAPNVHLQSEQESEKVPKIHALKHWVWAREPMACQRRISFGIKNNSERLIAKS